MQGPELVLRDVHVPPAPSLWPPAPGWWMLLAAVLAVALAAWWLRRRRQRRLRSWERLFDDACAQTSPSAQVAAISELLRRAARRADPGNERLRGREWLVFLDGDRPGEFSAGIGTLLLEGAYRRHLDAGSATALQGPARRRYMELMAGRRR